MKRQFVIRYRMYGYDVTWCLIMTHLDKHNTFPSNHFLLSGGVLNLSELWSLSLTTSRPVVARDFRCTPWLYHVSSRVIDDDPWVIVLTWSLQTMCTPAWRYRTPISKVSVFRQWSTGASISSCQYLTCKCALRRPDGIFVLGNLD